MFNVFFIKNIFKKWNHFRIVTGNVNQEKSACWKMSFALQLPVTQYLNAEVTKLDNEIKQISCLSNPNTKVPLHKIQLLEWNLVQVSICDTLC